jgi:beta-N-acetylhexosaminidase
MPCGKHFPGHGDTHLDSHLALPVVEHNSDRLESIELRPFKLAAPHLPMIMTAHVLFKAWDSDNPATLSEAILCDRLRGDCGFEGVVITDDLMMKAVSTRYPPGELAVRAVTAGVDLLLICNNLEAAELARRAVIERASADESFARRVMESAERVDALAKTIPPWTPDLSKARAVVGCAEHQALVKEVRR